MPTSNKATAADRSSHGSAVMTEPPEQEKRWPGARRGDNYDERDVGEETAAVSPQSVTPRQFWDNFTRGAQPPARAVGTEQSASPANNFKPRGISSQCAPR